MPTGSLLLLAGPNGAGKSSLFQSIREEFCLAALRSLNADDRTLEKIRGSGYAGFNDRSLEPALLKRMFIESANEVYQEALELLRAGKSVCLETVLSTDKFCPMVTEVLETGGKFELIYIALSSPDLSRERVHNRVSRDGHDVPVERLRERWERSLVSCAGLSGVPADSSHTTTRAPNRGCFCWEAPAPSPGSFPRDSVFPELRLALEAEFPELG